LNSLRGKLIKKKFVRPKWFSHKRNKKKSYYGRKDFLVGLSLFPFFVGLWENHFGLTNFFFINLPLKLFNFNFIWFFPR
jgi:hypothetical protein